MINLVSLLCSSPDSVKVDSARALNTVSHLELTDTNPFIVGALIGFVLISLVILNKH